MKKQIIACLNLLSYLRQIGKTKNILQIFDDGNVMPGGMYNNESVMTALKNKIKKMKILKLIFNLILNLIKIVYLNLQKSLKKILKLSIILILILLKRKGEEVHFRISDNGRICHISDINGKKTREVLFLLKNRFSLIGI